MLLRHGLFSGALFAGALFGPAETVADEALWGPGGKTRQYWAWTANGFVYGDTVDAVRAAIEASPAKPKLRIGDKTVRLPKPPKVITEEYIGQAIVFAEEKKTEIQAQADKDEIAVVLLALGIAESDQIVIAG